MNEGRRILLADDEHAFHRALQRVTQAVGWTLISVESAADVVTTAAEARPDLILLDMRFPDADGRDILLRLKSDARTAEIPVIVWSGHDLGSDRRIALDLGAEDYIEKVVPEELVAKIRRVMLRLEGG